MSAIRQVDLLAQPAPRLLEVRRPGARVVQPVEQAADPA